MCKEPSNIDYTMRNYQSNSWSRFGPFHAEWDNTLLYIEMALYRPSIYNVAFPAYSGTTRVYRTGILAIGII